MEGDTLPEVVRSDVPKRVAKAAEEAASHTDSDFKCTRFFRNSSAFLILLVAECGPETILEDGLAAAAFSVDGTALGSTQGTLPWNFFRSLVPAQRLRQ
jgi:hypothetical protein